MSPSQSLQDKQVGMRAIVISSHDLTWASHQNTNHITVAYVWQRAGYFTLWFYAVSFSTSRAFVMGVKSGRQLPLNTLFFFLRLYTKQQIYITSSGMLNIPLSFFHFYVLIFSLNICLPPISLFFISALHSTFLRTLPISFYFLNSTLYYAPNSSLFQTWTQLILKRHSQLI